MGTYIAIACCESVRRKSPANMIAMAIFTLSLSVWVSSIAIYHDVYWVFMAMGITAALVLGLTLFSFQTKIDFTVYSALMALLFSAFLIYDTQQILGGKKYQISPEEHVYASIQLYIDVVCIFLAFLNFGRR